MRFGFAEIRLSLRSTSLLSSVYKRMISDILLSRIKFYGSMEVSSTVSSSNQGIITFPERSVV